MENIVKTKPVVAVIKKLWGYILAAIGIVLLAKQTLEIPTLLIALGGYLGAIGAVELLALCEECCEEKQEQKSPWIFRIAKKLWFYLFAVTGIFLIAAQINPKLTLIALGGYLIGTGIASFKNRCDVNTAAGTQAN